MRIKQGTRRDLESVLDLLKSCNIECDNCKENIDRFILVADKDKIIGCTTYNIYSDYFEIRSLAIQKQHRNHTVKNILLKKLIERARSLGFDSIYARIKRENTQVISAAKKKGFVESEEPFEKLYNECNLCKRYEHRISTCIPKTETCPYISLMLKIQNESSINTTNIKL